MNRQKLISLEAARFFAAAAVMLFHYSAIVKQSSGTLPFHDLFRGGHAGVPFFFVLSGFIICHVHRNDIGERTAISGFVIKRAIRLFPMFLLISAAMLAAFITVPSLVPERTITPIGLVADLLLLPHSDAVLAISWTLRHEMAFYALFMLTFLVGWRALWLLVPWIAIGFAMPPEADAGNLGRLSILTSTLNLGFGLGVLIAIWLHRVPVRAAPVLIASGGFGIAVIWATEWMLGRGVPHDTVVLGDVGDIGYLLASATLILGLVTRERETAMPHGDLWSVLGGSSYLLYLVHQPVGSILMRLAPKATPMPAEAMFILFAVCAMTAAVLGHWYVERPLLRLLRRWLTGASSGLGASKPAIEPGA